jgi:predicted lipoprotein with Yx(FWY)xxD motif
MQTMRHRTSGADERGIPRAITRMARVVTLTVTLGMIGFLAAGSVASSATESNGTVSLRQTSLGRILVNARGHTLYLFAKDRNAKSSCNGSCARFWPPLLSRGKPTAGSGVKPSLLGTTRRSNGSMQVTYNKHPLYTYALDKRAGQTKGEGNSLFGAKWWAVSGKGRAVVTVPNTSSGTTATTTTATSTAACAYPPCP